MGPAMADDMIVVFRGANTYQSDSIELDFRSLPGGPSDFLDAGIQFWIIGIRNGYVFEASMPCPRPKSGQAPPPCHLWGLCGLSCSISFSSPFAGPKNS